MMSTAKETARRRQRRAEGVECVMHSWAKHGKEAEELRKGVEAVIEEYRCSGGDKVRRIEVRITSGVDLSSKQLGNAIRQLELMRGWALEDEQTKEAREEVPKDGDSPRSPQGEGQQMEAPGESVNG